MANVIEGDELRFKGAVWRVERYRYHGESREADLVLKWLRADTIDPVQVAAMCKLAGFEDEEIPVMVSIAGAESSFRPHLTYGNRGASTPERPAAGSMDYGLFQINDFYHPELFELGDWCDPMTSTMMAYAVYHKPGNNGYNTWSSHAKDNHLKKKMGMAGEYKDLSYFEVGEKAYENLVKRLEDGEELMDIADPPEYKCHIHLRNVDD